MSSRTEPQVSSSDSPTASARAELIVLTDKTIARIDDAPLWGQFIELAGRCINDGLYDPKSPHARSDGIREDVLTALRQLRPSYLRYPGGCAAAEWDWQELVGPKGLRPRGKPLTSTGVHQSPAFGLAEAHALCQELGCKLYFTINAHTQSPQDAANLVEYLNGTGATRWANLRREHGHTAPFGVTRFGLGNEIYGDWQPGKKTAAEYLAWCSEAIPLMKAIDPTIQIVVCGFGRPDPEWDRLLLKGLIDRIDLISAHNYFGRPNFKDCMSASLVFQQMLDQLGNAIDEAMDTRPSRKSRPGIATDEWNVWYRSKHTAEADLEEIYDYTDALTVASLQQVILRNADRVTMSNISLLVNTCGSLFTNREQLIWQTTFFPQKLFRDHHSGRVVESVFDGPTFRAKHERYFCGNVDVEKAKDETLPTLLHFEAVPALDVLATVDEGRRRLCVSVVQKLADRSIDVRLDIRGRFAPRVGQTVRIHTLTHPAKDLHASNTFEHPHRVGIASHEARWEDVFTFAPASLTVLEFEIE